MLIEQQVPQKQLQILRRLMDTVFQVIVIRADKGIAEIPRVLGKNIIRHVKTKRPQVLDKKYRRRSGIALAKHMDLPQVG